MPNTGIIMLGALGLMWLARGQNGGDQAPESLDSLLNADISSSGIFGGGSKEVLTPPVIGRAETVAVLSGNTAFTAMAVAADTAIPEVASNFVQPAPEIVGTLSALFVATGPTISEISGNAVRQVGLAQFDQPGLTESNYPQVAFINVSVDGVQGAPFEIDDEPIQVLPAINPGVVYTIAGNDQTTTVTTGRSITGDIATGTVGFMTTPKTIVAAIDQGYFSPAPAYVPRTWQQIEEDWNIAQGEPALVGASWIEAQSVDMDIGI